MSERCTSHSFVEGGRQGGRTGEKEERFVWVFYVEGGRGRRMKKKNISAALKVPHV